MSLSDSSRHRLAEMEQNGLGPGDRGSLEAMCRSTPDQAEQARIGRLIEKYQPKPKGCPTCTAS